MSLPSTLDMPDPIQIQCWQEMGASRRSALAQQLRQQVMSAKRSSLQNQHPDWSVNEVQKAAAQYFLRGQS